MPSIRYFKSRRAFYCQYRGHQYPLAKGPDDRPNGPTFLAAHEEFRRVMAEGARESAKDGIHVRLLCELYMQRTGQDVAPATQVRRQGRLRPFVAALGERPVRDLTHKDVTDFLHDMRTRRRAVKVPNTKKVRYVVWNESTCANFVQTLLAAIRWAVREELLSKNPLPRLKSEIIRSRGAESVITPGQHQMVLDSCHSMDMRDLLVALEHTGARPGELLAATAADWQDLRPDLGAFVFLSDSRRATGRFRHKTAGKKDRNIYFTGEVLEMVRARVRRHARGPVFCGPKGKPYRAGAIQNYLEKLRKRCPELGHVMPVSYRHTFATNWLLAGKSIDYLALVLGNTPQTIRRHYAHLCHDTDSILRHLEDFRGKNGSPPHAGGPAASPTPVAGGSGEAPESPAAGEPGPAPGSPPGQPS
jgi:integrase